MADKLLPCKKCGYVPEIKAVRVEPCDRWPFSFWRISCDTCGIDMQSDEVPGWNTPAIVSAMADIENRWNEMNKE